MYISKIKLHNFKGFKGDHELAFNKSVNFFVGDNNCGKSTIFEAIDFMRTKRSPDEVIAKKTNDTDFVSVEIEFKGQNLKTLFEANDLKKYAPALFEENNEEILRIRRSSESDASKAMFYTKGNGYKDLTGTDKTINALFDAQIIWADIDADDISDFSKTKICGRIINAITEDFANSDTWKSFQKSHEETFGDGKNGLLTRLKPIEKKLKTILSEQYGETEIKFNFSLPEIDNFFKTGNITLSENGVETKSTEKGTGMQRALALALIQVYADILFTVNEKEIFKPLIFFIDEPETFLHPQAQNKLLDALEKISEKSQVFIITHSPYLLKKYNKGTHSFNIFRKNKATGFNQNPESNITLTLFGRSSPTWGEINYQAFGITTEEFHNELYGFIQAKAILKNEKCYQLNEFDKYLIDKNEAIAKKKYKHLKPNGEVDEYSTTISTYIRNFMHHPENDKNIKYTNDELKTSIEKLILLV
jgi:predicted ATP-dependent endonuclease of OLD family